MEWCERHKPFAEPMLSDRAARFKLRREARAPRPHRQIEQDRATIRPPMKANNMYSKKILFGTHVVQ